MATRLTEAFTAHPRSVDETYLEHLEAAAGFGITMVGAGLACLVHAAFPFLFVHTGSRAIGSLNERMITHRRRRTAALEAAHPQSAD